MNGSPPDDIREMLHDIANALSPLMHYPHRIKNMARDMESSLEYLEMIQSEFARHGEGIGDYLLKDPKGQKMLPMLAELCKIERQNMERFREEYGRFARLLEKMKSLVTGQQIKLDREKLTETVKTAETKL